MRNIMFITIVMLLATACATTQPEPTSTPVPPTAPPPPTDTSIPPTQAPNPHAEEVFLALAEAINNQDYGKVRTFFSEDKTTEFDEELWGDQGLDSFIKWAAEFDETAEFNDFVITADEVEFKWYSSIMGATNPDADPQVITYKCYARATMEEDKILTLRVFSCAKL